MGLDLYARIEELFLDKEAADTLWMEFIKIFKEYNIDDILDIGCGSGQFCDLASRYGINIKGIDLSKKQVEKAKKLCDCEAVDVCELNKKFKNACAVFDVVNYMNEIELKRFFQCVEKIIDEYFIFDINTYYAMSDLAVGTLKAEEENRFSVLYSDFYDDKLVTEITLFEKVGECYNKEQKSITQYYHSLKDIENLTNLKLIDVVPVSLYGSEEAEKLILVMKKAT
jgi:cyclopropane fatty-acyl-phospholipid synthase-like methyltransferase